MPVSIPIFNGPIAIFDMLGFKEFVANTAIQDIIDNYAHIITSSAYTAEVLEEDLQFMVYSDTIAIRLVNTTENGFSNFIKSIQIILNQYFYKLQVAGFIALPLRGAIAHGEYSWHIGDISTQVMNRPLITARQVNFICGKAIIDAHEQECLQNWIGISLNLKTGQKLKELFPHAFCALEESKHLVFTQVPTKNGYVEGWAVNPTERSTFPHVFASYVDKCAAIIPPIGIN